MKNAFVCGLCYEILHLIIIQQLHDKKKRNCELVKLICQCLTFKTFLKAFVLSWFLVGNLVCLTWVWLQQPQEQHHRQPVLPTPVEWSLSLTKLWLQERQLLQVRAYLQEGERLQLGGRCVRRSLRLLATAGGVLQASLSSLLQQASWCTSPECCQQGEFMGERTGGRVVW